VESYDALVIGAGQAGIPLARDLARAGWKTALIERAHVGGTCYNEGCTPTKTMAASARVAHLAKRARDYGIETGPVTVDMKAVRQRKRDLVESWRTGSERRLRETPNLELIIGEGSFLSSRAVSVRTSGQTHRVIEAPRVFINTGARPAIPPLPGLADVPYFDSTSIMELDVVPEHLVILGSGYVAVEFGQMFRRFGSRVTMVARGDRILSREDADVSEALAEILREDGIDILLSTKVERADVRTDKEIFLEVGSGEQSGLQSSHLLVATGRRANTEALNLQAAGIQVDADGHIPVNDRLETSIPGVWALGDVKGGPAFTHISYDDYRVTRTNLLGKGDASTTDRLVPYTVFTDPQLGRIGLSEEAARAKGLDFLVKRLPMDYVARALETDEARGFMKALIEVDSGRVLGAAVLGVDGGETAALIELAMLGDLTAERLHDAIFAHPTLAESLNNLFAPS
jgi:pyruvate/2-oxoglutarate dehydrogenase complex dihydrolipoamide dehydrogenase (E3) component